MKKQSVFHYMTSLWLVLLPFISLGQQSIKDSLRDILDKETLSQEEYSLTKSRLARVISYKNYAEGRAKIKAVIQSASANSNHNSLAFAWAVYSSIETRNDHNEEAQRALDSALIYANDASDFIRGIVWYRKGYLENLKNKPEQAIESWHKATDFFQDTAGGQKYLSGIYYQKYGIYADKENDRKASEYARLALKKAQESQALDFIIAGWQIKGTDYRSRYRLEKDPALLDSAEYAYHQSVDLYKKKQSQLKKINGVALSALNLADIYLDHRPITYKDSILNYIDLALKVSSTTNDSQMQADSYNELSKFHWFFGHKEASKRALRKEKAILEKSSSTNYAQWMNLYQTRAYINEQEGGNAEALADYKNYIKYYKKNFDREKSNVIHRLEAKYEAEKKDKKLQLLSQHNAYQKKKITLYSVIGVIVILGLILLFLVYRFRLKYALEREESKANQTARLEAEHKLVQTQKEQMQKELMAGALQIAHKNEILQNLKDKFANQTANSRAAKNLSKIINAEMRIDDDFEQIKTEIKNIHPDFFKVLQEKAQEHLTDLDLKYSAYIYMNLDNKQIATLLNIAPKSVRMAKYRLKQKIGLDKEIELTDWIKGLNP